MIQQIFIPKTFGNYYVIPQRVLGIEITKTRLRATQLYLKGNSVTLEKFFEIIIEADQSIDYTERVRSALKTLLQQADNPDIVRTSISSALVITKEIIIPFVDQEKIRLMLPLELEGYVPFNINDAITDFIITGTDKDNQKTSIFAAAVQKKDILHHLSYFNQTPFDPEVVTIDVFDLYALYTSLPLYSQYAQAVVLIDINMHTTRLACIVESQLRLIRTLPKGLIQLASQVSKKLHQGHAKSLENIIRFGLEEHDEPNHTQIVREALILFWNDIQFTLQSFTTQLHLTQKLEKIMLLGDITTIPGIVQYVAQLSSIPTEIFPVNELITHNIISSSQRIPQTHIISLGCAYPSKITKESNLRQNEFAFFATQQALQQMATGALLAFLVMFSLISYSFFITKRLGGHVQQAEQEVVFYLQEQQLTQESNLVDAFNEAEKTVEEEERLWFAFSRQRRFSFLEHLQKLSESIDRQSIGLELKKLVISENSITFDGKVKDYEGLKIFERELQESNLFSYVPTLQETTFTNMKLPLSKTNEVAS